MEIVLTRSPLLEGFGCFNWLLPVTLQYVNLVRSLCTILQFGNLKLAAVILSPHPPFLLLPTSTQSSLDGCYVRSGGLLL